MLAAASRRELYLQLSSNKCSIAHALRDMLR
jgi:hypothetical protein